MSLQLCLTEKPKTKADTARSPKTPRSPRHREAQLPPSRRSRNGGFRPRLSLPDAQYPLNINTLHSSRATQCDVLTARCPVFNRTALRVRRNRRTLLVSRDLPRASTVCRVEMWCGGVRLGISVSGPFGCRCLTSLAMAPFPHPAHQTGRAVFRHPAFGQGFTTSAASHVRPRTVGVRSVEAGIIPASGADSGHRTVSFHYPAP